MAGSSIGLNGQNINVGDYVKLPTTALGATAGSEGSYIGVVLAAGGNTIAGVYLTSQGTLTSFSNVQSSLCQQLGQASGPGNASFVGGQN